MIFSNEQLKSIEDSGAAEMPIEETAIILEVDLNDLISSPEAMQRYKKGQLETKFRIRQAVVRMAREGVPQMVKIYLDMQKTAIAPEIIRTAENYAEDYADDLPELEEQ